MSEEIRLSLEITAIGMSVVFGGILLLWLVMTLLVKLTGKREKQVEGEDETGELQVDLTALRQRAALAAVAVALARRRRDEPQPFPLPETTLVSAWQVVTRSHLLRKGGRLR
jgi:Na+-transporting methylmalonyl-CoA/oxaloacetate decarboxylase gamma subunit